MAYKRIINQKKINVEALTCRQIRLFNEQIYEREKLAEEIQDVFFKFRL